MCSGSAPWPYPWWWLVASYIVLARTGKTLPKAWLGLQVVALDHPVPGYWRAFVREGIGRWGTSLGGAYLIWIGCGAFPQLPWLGGHCPGLFYWLKA